MGLPKLPKKEKTPEAGELFALLAEYDSPGSLISAAEEVRDSGYTKWDCYSPFPVHGIDPAMGIQMTKLPWIVFASGLIGCFSGILLQWWTNAHFWPWIVSGKPFWSLPANIPVAFETTILFSVLSTFFGMWALNGLPQVWHPFFSKKSFLKATDDSFFIGIEASDPRFDKEATKKLLIDAGAENVEESYIDADPGKKHMPKGIYGIIVVTSFMALVPFALAAKARVSKSDKPHFHLIPDMDFQDKVKSQRDHAQLGKPDAERIDDPFAMSRDELITDPHLQQGISEGRWAVTFPPGLEFNDAFLDRGELKFNTYCRPCHGQDGSGQGIVNARAQIVQQDGWAQPANLVDPRIVVQPHGQLFNTISHGVTKAGNRTMGGYASQVSIEDRWAIVAYLRALQLSQNAGPQDVK